MQAEIS